MSRLFCIIPLLLLSWPALAEEAPVLSLAKVYREGVDLAEYWVSGKLDGIRA